MLDRIGYLDLIETVKVTREQIVEEMTSNWNETPLDIVMDLGCGPGNTSTFWINTLFPNIKRIIGIDIDPGMIALAKERYSKENVEFHVADIMEKHTLKEWEGRVDKVVSLHVLNIASDQKKAFQNIFDLLNSSGEAAVDFIIDAAYFDAIADLMKIPKWKSLLESTNFRFPDSYTNKYDVDYYKKMFEDVGFVVDVCKKRLVFHSTESDEDCKDFLLCLHSLGPVSNEVKEDFKKDLFEQYEKYSARDSEGRHGYRGTLLFAKLHRNTDGLKRQIIE